MIDMIDKLRGLHQRMGALLDDPHPGLFTWRFALRRVVEEMDDCWAKSSLETSTLPNQQTGHGQSKP